MLRATNLRNFGGAEALQGLAAFPTKIMHKANLPPQLGDER